MSRYSSNNIAIETPPGSIVAYLGTKDPPGWVICDGIARPTSGSSSNWYTNLIAMGIGTTINSTYSPPNLSGQMIRSGGTLMTVNGSNTVTLTADQLPKHTHPLTAHTHDIVKHTHTITDHKHSVPAQTITLPDHIHNMEHRHNIQTYVQDYNFDDDSSAMTVVMDADVNIGLGNGALFKTIPYSLTSGQLFAVTTPHSDGYTINSNGSVTYNDVITTTGSPINVSGTTTTTTSNTDDVKNLSTNENTTSGLITALSANNLATGENTTNTNTISIIPAYYGVNWILKL